MFLQSVKLTWIWRRKKERKGKRNRVVLSPKGELLQPVLREQTRSFRRKRESPFLGLHELKSIEPLPCRLVSGEE